MPTKVQGSHLVRLCADKRYVNRTELIIRFGYGAVVPWVRRYDGSLRAVAGPNRLSCSPIDFDREAGPISPSSLPLGKQSILR
jgi:hypothetical protein